jgi:hypothetical protein
MDRNPDKGSATKNVNRIHWFIKFLVERFVEASVEVVNLSEDQDPAEVQGDYMQVHYMQVEELAQLLHLDLLVQVYPLLVFVVSFVDQSISMHLQEEQQAAIIQE